MNCRQVQNILPEFVSGEVDIAIHLAASEHISECSPCRLEMHKYEAALGALERAFEPVQVPEALNTFTIPESEHGRRFHLRLGLAAACLAVVLIAVFAAPRLLHQPAPVKQALTWHDPENNDKPQMPAPPEAQPEKKTEDSDKPTVVPITAPENKPEVKQEQKEAKPVFPLPRKIRKPRNYYASAEQNTKRSAAAQESYSGRKHTPKLTTASTEYIHKNESEKPTRIIVADTSPDSPEDITGRQPAKPVAHNIARPIVAIDSYGNKLIAIAESDDIGDINLLDIE